MFTNTSWWHSEEDSIVCELCPRNCKIKEGKRGFCFVRKNEGGHMVLTTYGKSTGFCIDPIEKKPLNHFYPGTPVLSFGTAGCNLGCKFCQNWDISKSREIEVLSQLALPEDIVHSAKMYGCRSIAYTYNDPTTWAEYVIDTAKVAREEGIKNIAVTAGYINPDARKALYRYIDAANVDLKAFTEIFYKRLTRSSLVPVLDTLKWLVNESDVWVEITTLLIPGENDSSEEIKLMCEWLLENLGANVPLHFTAFHPDYKMLKTAPTPHSTLVRARNIALQQGINFVYIGNCLDKERQSTYCSKCDALLIERDHYELGVYKIKDGYCCFCKEPIVGFFESVRGTWGRKRLPIKISKKPEDGMKKVENKIVVQEKERVSFLTKEESQEVLKFTRSVVESAVTGSDEIYKLSDDLYNRSIYGVFVTLKRGKLLRGCTGVFDLKDQGLGAFIKHAAISTAVNDTRFPAIALIDVALCNLEISIMHTPEDIDKKGEDRLTEVEVGKHGLLLKHPMGRALFLPQVPLEQKWDKITYIENLCQKAHISTQAWKEDECELMRFQCHIFEQNPKVKELNLEELRPNLGKMLEVVEELVENRNKDKEKPSFLTQVYTGLFGLRLTDTQGLSSVSFTENRSLLSALEIVVEQLTKLRIERGVEVGKIEQIVLMTHAIPLRFNDYPSRFQTLIHSTFLVQKGKELSCTFPGSESSLDRVSEALEGFNVSKEDWKDNKVNLIAFQCHGIQRKEESKKRSPAVSGTFYPGSNEEMERSIHGFFNLYKKKRGKKVRALLLPHAGWQYCGHIIAKTLSEVRVPKKVIIIGPKHTALGAKWSVSHHEEWEFPGVSVPVLTELAQKFSKSFSQLVCEGGAHQKEHSIEVQVPFLHYRNKNIEILPIALGHSSYEELDQFALKLHQLLKEEKEQPLLVISSDMNHFADEIENRRLDKMALDAFELGDPRVLYDLCIENKISMCGILPTVLVMKTLLLDSSKLSPKVVLYDTSATVSGDSSRVVGYAGGWIK